MFWRKKAVPELTVSSQTRRSLLANALNGASHFEKLSLAEITVDVKPGVDPASVSQRLDQLLAEVL